MIYLIFHKVTEDSVLSGKLHVGLSEKAKLTELKFKTLKLAIQFVFHG